MVNDRQHTKKKKETRFRIAFYLFMLFIGYEVVLWLVSGYLKVN